MWREKYSSIFFSYLELVLEDAFDGRLKSEHLFGNQVSDSTNIHFIQDVLKFNNKHVPVK